MFFKSIRFSLTLRYSLTLAVILVLFSSFLYLTITKQFYREVDKELYTIAEALASPTLEPFRNSAPSVFDQVLADIGDNQSIAESLSTFSAHIQHVGRMIEAVSRENVKGIIKSTSADGAHTMTMNGTFTAKWIGPCPEAK